MAGNLIQNPRFKSANMEYWQVNGAEWSIDGNSHYGAAYIPLSGGYIEQAVAIEQPRSYTLSFSIYSAAFGVMGVRVLAQDGTQIYLEGKTTVGGSWDDKTVSLTLAEGSYTIRFYSSTNDIYLDDVSLAYIPASRQGLAERAHAALASLATEFSLSYSADEEKTEGDYTFKLDEALLELGFIDEFGAPDVRCLDNGDVAGVVDLLQEKMMRILHNMSMARPSSYSIGGLTENYELTKSIAMRLGMLPGQGSQSSGTITTKKLKYGGWGG